MDGEQSRIGRYVIVEEVGHGAFATVYSALDVTLDRRVALKVLHPRLLAEHEFVERFKREARALAALSHPHIVTIYEIGEADGRLFIAMELARGHHLGQVITERGCIPWEEALALLRPICEALDYAHDQGVVHRDLKPANVVLDQDQGPLLTDFGIARLIGDSSASLSLSGGILGTAPYIAPEVWELDVAEAPADVYALGCIVCEMLTGQVLFAGQTPMQVMRAHDRGPRFPEKWPPGVPEGNAAVLGGALARDPGSRFASACRLWQALNELSAVDEAPMEEDRGSTSTSHAMVGVRPALDVGHRGARAPTAESDAGLALRQHEGFPEAERRAAGPGTGPSQERVFQDSGAVQASVAVLNRRKRTSVLPRWAVCTLVLGAIAAVVLPAIVLVMVLSSSTKKPSIPEELSEYDSDWITFRYPRSWSYHERSSGNQASVVVYEDVDSGGRIEGGACVFAETLNDSGIPSWLVPSALVISAANEGLKSGFDGTLGIAESCTTGRPQGVKVSDKPATQMTVRCSGQQGEGIGGWIGAVSPVHLSNYVFVYCCLVEDDSGVDDEKALQEIMESVKLNRGQ